MTRRIREYAVLKAIGRDQRPAGRSVTVQVPWTVALAPLLATALALLLAWAVPLLAPAVSISIAAGAPSTTTLSALAVGLVAALWPLRRIATLDRVTAFRGTR